MDRFVSTSKPNDVSNLTRVVTFEAKRVCLATPGDGCASPPRAGEDRGAVDHTRVEVVEHETTSWRGHRRDFRNRPVYGVLGEVKGDTHQATKLGA